MIFELRTYTASPGRLDDLLRRFETITVHRWKCLGVELAGFWIAQGPEAAQEVVYLLRWASMEERDRVWSAFQADPEWVAKRAETEKNGTLVAAIRGAFMEATSFSPMR